MGWRELPQPYRAPAWLGNGRCKNTQWELAPQRTVQGSIDSATKSVTISLSNLVATKTSRVLDPFKLLGGKQLCTLEPGLVVGHVGLRVAVCIGQLYQQAMLDSDKLKALSVASCHLAEAG